MARLDYHDRIRDTAIDGMHTIKDVVSTIVDAINGGNSYR